MRNSANFHSIDARTDNGRLGRLVNDSPDGNCRMKKIMIGKQPCLCLFASKDIAIGEELRYDSGVMDLPWRVKVCYLLVLSVRFKLSKVP